MRLDVWSDVICPWCYIGKRNLEAALELYEAEAGPDREPVEVVWRSFELDPGAPTDRHTDLAETLGRKYGTDRDGALRMMDRVASVAEDVGLHYRFDIAKRCNTFDAHRVIHLALDVGGPGLQAATKERLFSAYFTEGADLGDRAVLASLAAGAEGAAASGLDAEAVAGMLATDRFTDEVRADEASAREIGVTGVPFFVVESVGVGVSGAQPPDRLAQMLLRARA